MTRVFFPFHQPDLGDEEVKAVEEVLRSGWLTTGTKTKQFEADFAKFLGVRHSVAVNSCTAALHLALDAIGIKEGDEVIVPTMTFAATAEVVLYFKARPILVDCRADTLNMDPIQIERLITSKTRAIIPVHFGGQACEMDQIMEISRKYHLKVIEDAAHAFPADYKGKMIGTIGDITCFSFYATKTITTGEGGMITTENEEYADRIRVMSLHGISRDAWRRYTEKGSWYYEILRPGYKYNLTDIAAAIGLEQLKKSDRFWDARRRIATLYNESFADMPELRIPDSLPDRKHAWHLYVIRLVPERLKIDRGAFIEELTREGIGTSVHFIPLHLHPYYRDAFGYRRGNFPKAEAAFEEIISLPIYSLMAEEDAQRVIQTIRGVIERNRR